MHNSQLSTFIALTSALATYACGDDRTHDRPSTAPASQNAAPEPPAAPPATGANRERTVYVPAYSHLPRGRAAENRTLLSTVLSVRNIDPAAVITLNHVDYFDTSGHRVRRYLERPRNLRPLETAEYWVDTKDEAGGSGANFLVYWEGPSDAQPLLTESVNIGHMGSGYTAITSRGVELKSRPDKPEFEPRKPDPSSSPDAESTE